MSAHLRVLLNLKELVCVCVCVCACVCMCVCACALSHSVMSNSLQPHRLIQPA